MHLHSVNCMDKHVRFSSTSRILAVVFILEMLQMDKGFNTYLVFFDVVTWVVWEQIGTYRFVWNILFYPDQCNSFLKKKLNCWYHCWYLFQELFSPKLYFARKGETLVKKLVDNCCFLCHYRQLVQLFKSQLPNTSNIVHFSNLGDGLANCGPG